MSGLYAGITFSKGAVVAAAGSSSNIDAASPNATGSGPAMMMLDQLEEGASYAAAQAEQAARDQAESQRKAALAFGPVVRRKPGTTSKPKTAVNALATATISAAPTLIATVQSHGSHRTLGAVPAKGTMHMAPAVSEESSTAAPTTHVLTGRTLVVPPSMTLDAEDINGFRGTTVGKKAANKAKKRNKKNKNKEEDPALAWTAEYDPARPTDYNEYKIYAKITRAERQEQLRREKERQKRLKDVYNGSGTESEYSEADEDSDDERRRRIENANSRFFAPPKVYDQASQAVGQESAETVIVPDVRMEKPPDPFDVDEAEGSKVSDVIAKQNEDDDWASWNATPVVHDDPYAKRMAISTHSNAELPSGTITVPTQPQASSEAPSFLASASPQPTFVSSRESIPLSPFDHSALGLSPLSATYAAPAPPQPMYPSSLVQYSNPIPTLTPALAPAQPVASIPNATVGVSIEEAQAKARAIAARLASLNKLGSASQTPAPSSTSVPSFPARSPAALPPIPGIDEPIPGLGNPSPSPSTSTLLPEAHLQQVQTQPKESVKPEDFAKSLMAKYGWAKGQGLGASSQGMLNPLALSGASEASKKKSKGKQQEQEVPHQLRLQGSNKVIGMATVKGRVISEMKTEKDKMERAKFGEPSRIVCLSNMVAREEVDDELVADVSAEARKLGVLEECFVHLMPSYVPEDEAVRVFLVFTGLVGAWKAVKEFDGRFFGGRTVRVKFYDELAFQTGTLHL